MRSVFNYFSHRSFTHIILHADTLTDSKCPIVFVASFNEYALVFGRRCTRFAHYIM